MGRRACYRRPLADPGAIAAASVPILATVEVRVITWNLFHGRDRAPDPALHTWRSRLLRGTERGPTHAQVNRDLYRQFADLLGNAEWDLALLQECPPRWAESLATDCGAEPHLTLTARNLPGPLDRPQRALGRLNPDLLASWEGGSNLTLLRSHDPARSRIAERRELILTRSPETRKLAWSRLEFGLCVANLHVSTARAAAEREVAAAAEAAIEWAGDSPLVLGGDFNLRPAAGGELFAALQRDHGLSPPSEPAAIDHLLVRGLEVASAPAAWPPERREVPDPTAPAGAEALPIRLSDHAPVEGSFGLSDPPG
jgi:endonuclease/exonuclease/phosphatase family metal-dependent hydrolase